MLYRLKLILMHNLPLKIYAVLLTAALFFIAGGSVEKQRRVIIVKTDYENLASNLQRLSPIDNIEIEVNAPAEVLSRENDFLKATADLKDLDAGRHTINVNIAKTHEQIEILSYNPKQVKISLEEKIEKKFIIALYTPVMANRVYKNKLWKINPGEVTVKGATSKVRLVYQVIAKIPPDFTKQAVIQLQAYSANEHLISDIEIIPSEVMVNYGK